MFLNSKGSLIFVIFLLMFFAFIGALMVSLLGGSSVSSSESLLSAQAFYLAESGKEIAIERCISGNFCDNATYNMGNGSIIVNFLGSAAITLDNGTHTLLYTATSEGELDGFKREIEFKFWK